MLVALLPRLRGSAGWTCIACLRAAEAATGDDAVGTWDPSRPRPVQPCRI